MRSAGRRFFIQMYGIRLDNEGGGLIKKIGKFVYFSISVNLVI